jgi:TolB protein
MTTQATTQIVETTSKRRRSLLLGLGVGVALAGAVALAGVAQQADAAAPEKIVFVSERTTGKGVSNPTGDAEIFRMNPNGTGVRQLTFNQADEFRPFLSPDGQKIAYMSRGAQPSNPEGDDEIYVMNASDGSGQKNLTDNSAVLDELFPQFSPDGTKISYQSEGIQDSNPQGDSEVYIMNASDGSGKTNLSKKGPYVGDYSARFSLDGQKIVYTSSGEQASNPEGDDEVYVMNSDGNKRKNLTNNGLDADGFGANDWTHYAEFSADGQKILYASQGAQATNPEGEAELYLMNAPDGSAKKNLTNNTARDFYAEWGR